MVYIYRKHPYAQGDAEQKYESRLTAQQLAGLFTLQAESITLKRSDDVGILVDNAVENIPYTVHGVTPPAQGATPTGPLWGSTGLSGSSSHSDG
ncbi:hypothetical protein PROFUN_12002 [Planoprotostelium fungivorum]|uniref:Uncharacterized protein n=1 Tax=Planoprotostelium fungivorum TaxID=1890364 RepID=A0A2P6MRC0_9EUKA|nr:hypothetical protein PROFUN_12002 [Planoprotostelium fungivorum]